MSEPRSSLASSAAADPRSVLETVFGHREFRSPQAEIVDHVIAGGDALVLMPTGGGKSVCFQIPALCRRGMGVVVSPLIALMDDQVAQLRQSGVRALALTSALAPGAARAGWRAIDRGEIDLLYVSPERLVGTGGNGSLLDRLGEQEIALFAIDEAHCVSQWGHDFRPEYRQLAQLADRFASVPRIALTATADEMTRRDIAAQLKLESARLFVASFDRPNIRYLVREKDNPKRQILEFIEREHSGEAGIVYAMSRKRVEDMADFLTREAIPALPYHAGLGPETRATHHERFLMEDGLVMVATIAFGMGINKPDIRFVAHMDMPKSFEAYYQETGRAGRDGLPADALMVYGLEDMALLHRMMDESTAPEEVRRIEQKKLDALLGYCETVRCRREVLLEYFGEGPAPCGNCDTCLEPVDVRDGTHEARLALSAIRRTGESFGAGHIVDILTGKATPKVTRWRHDRLQLFGMGTDLGPKQWKSLIRQMVAAGLVRVDLENHSVLRFGSAERVLPILRNETRFDMRAPTATRERVKARSRTAKEGLGQFEERDRELFESLRHARMELASAQSVPAYIVFNDATLVEIVRRRPRSLEEFREISGVGESKLERYGQAFLAVVNAEENPNTV